MAKKNLCIRYAKPEDVRICSLCGEMILGEYDYIRTRRKTELYIHKDMDCMRDGRSKRK